MPIAHQSRFFLRLLLFMALAPFPSGRVFAQAVDTNLWVTDAPVNAVVRDGNTIYIGGQFTRVGPATGSGVPIDAATGGLPASFPKVTGYVYAVVPDGAGGWYVGGSFTAVGGVPRTSLAHVTSALTVSGWNPSCNGLVYTLAVGGSTVYVGGQFSSIGGQTRNRIAALDGTTGSATAWDPNADNYVAVLAVSGSTVYAGGPFTNIGGQARSRAAALDATTGLATAWDPNANGEVLALAVSGSVVYAGGNFTTIGGQTRNRIAALDVTTGAATAWNPNANSTVEALAVSSSTVYAGGFFTNIGGQFRSYLAALDAATGAATSWNPGAGNAIYSLAVSGSTVYAGGNFTSIGGQQRSYLAAVDATTGAATSWNPSANQAVGALAVSGSTVYAGGNFTSLGAQVRSYIAAVDAATGMATAWNPNSNNFVEALAVSGSIVYAGGNFTTIGGQPRNRIAALDVATGSATSWSPSANGIVWDLLVSGSTVYAGGAFTQIGGQVRNRIAALDAATGAATAWDPNANNEVYSLASSGSTVYASGAFTTVGGGTRNYIAALDATTGAVTAWNPNASNTVWELAANGSTVYAGGDFLTIGGQPRNRIAALDASTGAATSWNPNANNRVFALNVSGATVYAGGFFTTIGGQTRRGVAALRASNGVATAWNPNLNISDYANDLTVSGSTVHVGGYFRSVGMEPQSFLASMRASPALTSVVPSSGGNSGPVTVTMYGEGLGVGASVSLTRSGQPSIPGSGVTTALDGSSMTATFDLNGALAGLWNVVVTLPDAQTATLGNGFTIEEVEAPQLRVSIVGTANVDGNPAIRRDRRTAIDLVIENPGNMDALSVPVWLAGVPLDATLELDFVPGYPPQAGGEPSWSTVPAFFTGPAGKYVPVVIPRVPPGSTTLRLYVTVPGPTHPPFTLIAAVAPPWMDGAVFRSCLTGGGGITDPVCMGAQLDAFNAHLAANPSIPAFSGIAFWAKNAWQCEGAATLPAALAKAEEVLDFLEGSVESGTAPAGCLNVSRPSWRDVVTITVVGSIDPNDKLGMQGSFSGQTVLPYSIRFENFASASLPAQDVIVTDQLNPSVLDLSTVSLEQITFGNRTIFPPPGLSSFSTTVDLRPQKNLLVNVSASLDPVTNVLSWYFNSIDPATGRTPTDFQVGFLPPNVAPPEGEGSVMFTVMPQPGLATGTQISNSASILFDDPPALTTAAWTNGVDNSPPSSNVQPLAPQSNQQSIPVSWTAPGSPSDLRDFTIYVKQDQGPYRVWRLNTPTTSDTLVPPNDHKLHTFTFYSVARDQVGNMEAPPAVPDATTQSTTAVGDGAPGLLSLAGARPNPARGAIHVWLSLPSREPATLELLDVAGRRILRRDVGSLGPGAHLVTLAPVPTPRAGLYFLRLTQGDRELEARFALIR